MTENTGTGVSYLAALYGRFGVSYLVSGCYRDMYVRMADGWQFQEMYMDFCYTVTAGAGLTGDEMYYLDPAFGRN